MFPHSSLAVVCLCWWLVESGLVCGGREDGQGHGMVLPLSLQESSVLAVPCPGDQVTRNLHYLWTFSSYKVNRESQTTGHREPVCWSLLLLTGSLCPLCLLCICYKTSSFNNIKKILQDKLCSNWNINFVSYCIPCLFILLCVTVVKFARIRLN